MQTEAELRKREKERERDPGGTTPLAVKTEGTVRQGKQAASRSGKGNSTGYSIELPEGTRSCPPILEFQHPEL